MKNYFSIIIILLLSCSPNKLERENMEIVDIYLDQPESYYWFDASKPKQGSLKFSCNEGPLTVRISGKTIEIDAGRPIKKVQHLRGKYGREAIILSLSTNSSFKVDILEPDPYAETFRIYY